MVVQSAVFERIEVYAGTHGGGWCVGETGQHAEALFIVAPMFGVGVGIAVYPDARFYKEVECGGQSHVALQSQVKSVVTGTG